MLWIPCVSVLSKTPQYNRVAVRLTYFKVLVVGKTWIKKKCQVHLLNQNLFVFFWKVVLLAISWSSLNQDGVPDIEFQVELPPFKKVGFIYFSRRPLKMIKNAFLSHVLNKSFFVLNIFKFLSQLLWSCRKTAWWESLIDLRRLISKFTASQTGKQIMTIHTLHKISRSKGCQTMKFGQLIE